MSKIINEDDQFQPLERWLFEQSSNSFPRYDAGKGESSYPKRYQELRQKLIPVHNKVEIGALLKSISDWKNELSIKIADLAGKDDIQSSTELISLQELVQRDPAIYLNQHGVGHVNKVIDKVDEVLSFFKEGEKLSPFETFILLCAIQIHDIRNIFGREAHEKTASQIFMETAKSIIPESFVKRLILKIAQVHSGRIYDDKDTISKSKLQIKGTLLEYEVRECLIAALLRFGDELADDISRADLQSLESDDIPPESLIYHEYSKSLHTVTIKKNEINNTLYLQLEYFIDFDTMLKKFIKEGKDILLIDEIFYRTKKVEQERRYCIRYFNQYLHLNEVKVRIEIASKYDLMDSEIINYTLAETGYPLNAIIIDFPYNTGEKVLEILKDKGWEV